ncbi:ComEC/Rec2 family competence protein [Salinibacillus xinjiangensis]|uniref:MBL fold metallo-hydrolase n=1 Tax=Salinibacillus xinjiangensis TaxID=1229268 RepID=A0A6G1XAA9_9BACI|nr:MBL fold metallo-hydrolase [Salinibacillus xinjiangensis]MRG87914.1 MBL fold metallo-hydrolase [Salinibacillus xinjiangensis]
MCKYIKVYPAANGDSFLIRIKDDSDIKNIIIDGGKGELCHLMLKNEFEQMENNNQRVNLLVVTHIDDDHIAGIIKIFKDKKVNTSIIDRVWFNSGTLIASELKGDKGSNFNFPIASDESSRKMSVRQGETLEGILEETGVWHKKLISTGQFYDDDGIILRVLSPDIETLKELNEKWDSELKKIVKKRMKKKMMSSATDYHKSINELAAELFEEDSSLFNKSSIAFLLEHENFRLLMLGDSHPSTIVNSLRNLGYSDENKLRVDIMKISHHASKKNTSPELLKLIDCEKFIISSDGSKHGLPNKESLARIIQSMDKPVAFYFNYNLMKKIFSPEECQENNITCVYLNRDNGYTVGG